MDWVITNAPNMLISAAPLSMLTRIEPDSAALDGAFSTRTAVGLSTALTIGTGSEPGRTVAVPSPCSAGNALTGLAPRRATVSRSEEHTSELQSLMRISYAVFSLKNKKSATQQISQHTQTPTTASEH